MTNELTVGTRRTGSLFDFEEDTPEVHVTLSRSERGIYLTVPWSDTGSPYAGWFDSDGFWGSHREQSAPRPVPKRLHFDDSHGSVLLVGCWPQGFHTDIDGPGSGTIWARAAIMGVEEDVDYEFPTGLQTEISGLRDWLGVSSWRTDVVGRSGGRSATIKSVHASTVDVGTIAGLTVELVPGWQMHDESNDDRLVLRDVLRCRTMTGIAPAAWDDHLRVHRAVRDLLLLSRWHEESCVPVSVSRYDDPLRTMDGRVHDGVHWRDAVVPNDRKATPPRRHRRHLIEYEDIGPRGLARWAALREKFSRALDPVISSIGVNSTEFTVLAHTGPGLEALGYLLLLRDGLPDKAAASAPLHRRLERILADVEPALPFDGPTWVRSTVSAYNGLKHANRRPPDPVDLANAWRECVLATRIWVAQELGVPTEKIAKRLAGDPQRHPFVRRG